MCKNQSRADLNRIAREQDKRACVCCQEIKAKSHYYTGSVQCMPCSRSVASYKKQGHSLDAARSMTRRDLNSDKAKMSIEETRAELAESLASVFKDHPKQSGTVAKGIFYQLDRKRYRVTHRGQHVGYYVTLAGAESAKAQAVRASKINRLDMEIAELEKRYNDLLEERRKLEDNDNAG